MAQKRAIPNLKVTATKRPQGPVKGVIPGAQHAARSLGKASRRFCKQQKETVIDGELTTDWQGRWLGVGACTQ